MGKFSPGKVRKIEPSAPDFGQIFKEAIGENRASILMKPSDMTGFLAINPGFGDRDLFLPRC